MLAYLCKSLLNRKLFKCNLQTERFDEDEVQLISAHIQKSMNISAEEAGYLVFTGEAENTTYKIGNERINILYRDGSVKIFLMLITRSSVKLFRCQSKNFTFAGLICKRGYAIKNIGYGFKH